MKLDILTHLSIFSNRKCKNKSKKIKILDLIDPAPKFAKFEKQTTKLKNVDESNARLLMTEPGI